VRHLLTFGPTSASDPELLSDLGTSRARATQVLRRLEDMGLVHASAEKSGIGRPRKLYAVRHRQVEGA
jgi:predicted ArsR family transcriptional regulator